MPQSDVKTTRAFNVQEVRQDFPILSRKIHGKPLVYLDNAASAQKPRQVIEAIQNTYADEYANVHRGLHYLSNLATQRYEQAREHVRAFINARTAEEIVFTRNATEAINLVAYSYAAPNISSGDEIILSVLEHHSNIVPWHFLRERQGAILKWAPISPDGDFLIDEFDKLISPKTRLIAITHMSNVLGSIVPVKEIISRAHARQIPVLIDGSQAAAHLQIDVRDLDADFYVFTGHKVYGPTGVGVLYGKKELLNSMPPFNGGGEMIVDVDRNNVTYTETPQRFEAGTPPIVQAIGLGVAIDYMMHLDRNMVMEHEMMLLHYASAGLSSINGLRILGNPASRGSILSFELDGVHASDLSTILDHEGIAIRAGTHCAQILLKNYGLTSVCRASFAMYNDLNDVDRFIAALKKASGFFSLCDI